MFKSFLKFAAVAAFVFVIAVPFASAQEDYKKGEFSTGFLHKRIDGEGFNGMTFGGAYNVHRYFGVKGEFGWARKDGFDTYTYLGGLQVKDNSSEGSMIKPFGHVLLGTQRWDGDISGFSMAIGGGVDVKVSDRFSVRAIQYDYNPVWVDGTRVDTNRFGFGIVIH
jgi:opacity protein-like surface antigen